MVHDTERPPLQVEAPPLRVDPPNPWGGEPGVCFRTGAAFGPWLHQTARLWGVSISEVARRLAIMGATGFGPTHNELLERAADLWAKQHGKRESFARACHALRVIIGDMERRIGSEFTPSQIGAALELALDAWETTKAVEVIELPQPQAETVGPLWGLDEPTAHTRELVTA